MNYEYIDNIQIPTLCSNIAQYDLYIPIYVCVVYSKNYFFLEFDP